MKKLHKIPAQIAEPITPDELQAIPCINRKFVGSSLKPIRWTSRAEPGTADTPAAPSSGFIFCFRNMFMILAKITPDAVAIEKAMEPRKNIPRDLGVRKTSAWVLQPTVNPKKMVAVSMMADCAVLARRLTTPHSLIKLPKNNMPSSGRAVGARKQQSKTPATGNINFSFFETTLGSGIRMSRSSLDVNRRMIGG